MGVYSSVLFPAFLDLLMGRSQFSEFREELLRSASGRVLEVGIGTGLNLGWYPKAVEKVEGVDPAPGMSRYLTRRSRKTGIAVIQHRAPAEELPFPDGSFDTVVSTWTLCSVSDLERSLKEIHRVLKAGGRFLFVEHGLAPDDKVRRWQKILCPCNQWVAGGCHLDRDVVSELKPAGFEIEALRRFYLKGAPRTHGYFSLGSALKARD